LLITENSFYSEWGPWMACDQTCMDLEILEKSMCLVSSYIFSKLEINFNKTSKVVKAVKLYECKFESRFFFTKENYSTYPLNNSVIRQETVSILERRFCCSVDESWYLTTENCIYNYFYHTHGFLQYSMSMYIWLQALQGPHSE